MNSQISRYSVQDIRILLLISSSKYNHTGACCPLLFSWNAREVEVKEVL